MASKGMRWQSAHSPAQLLRLYSKLLSLLCIERTGVVRLDWLVDVGERGRGGLYGTLCDVGVLLRT